jgi:hypothetical protein
MSEPPGESIIEIAVNDLATRTLNAIPYESSESVAEAIDGLEKMMRRSALALTVALLDVANAIRDTQASGANR